MAEAAEDLCHRSQGTKNLELAEKYCAAAVESYRAADGPFLMMALAAEDLGNVREKIGAHEGALEAFRLAETLQMVVNGSHSIEVYRLRLRYAQALAFLERFQEAESIALQNIRDLESRAGQLARASSVGTAGHYSGSTNNQDGRRRPQK